MKLPHAEVKFYPEVNSQTSLSSLRVSCKRALSYILHVGRVNINYYKSVHHPIPTLPVGIGNTWEIFKTSQ